VDATVRMNQFVLQPRGVVTMVFGSVAVLGVKKALLSIGGAAITATAKLPHDHMTALSASSKCSGAALYETDSRARAFTEMRCGNLCSYFTRRIGQVRAVLGPAKRCIYVNLYFWLLRLH
jgi:hypothetical protein